MANKNIKISFWYIVILFSLIVAVLWFYGEIIISKKSATIPRETQEVAKSIKDSIPTAVIEKLHKKQVISDIDLQNIKPYTESITFSKENVKKITDKTTIETPTSESTESSKTAQ